MKLTVGRRIEKMMIDKGMKQIELARVTGISQTVLSRYINEWRMPTVKNIVKIANALNVDVGVLVGQYEDE